MPTLAGKNIVITGASRGFGAALASEFWRAGGNLLLCARSGDALARVVGALPKKADQRALFLACDLLESRTSDDILREARRSFPKVDILVNNAAIHGPIGPLWQNDMFLWRQTLQVNLLAPVALCHAFASWMMGTGGGVIINMSGGGAASPRPNFTAYSTAKAGLVRFSETFAAEVSSRGIRVNCIAPGSMTTALTENLPENLADRKGEALGSQSMSQAVALALFLASDESQGITGKLISARWDHWESFASHREELARSDVYTLRRIVGRERGFSWGDK